MKEYWYMYLVGGILGVLVVSNFLLGDWSEALAWSFVVVFLGLWLMQLGKTLIMERYCKNLEIKIMNLLCKSNREKL